MEFSIPTLTANTFRPSIWPWSISGTYICMVSPVCEFSFRFVSFLLIEDSHSWPPFFIEINTYCSTRAFMKKRQVAGSFSRAAPQIFFKSIKNFLNLFSSLEYNSNLFDLFLDFNICDLFSRQKWLYYATFWIKYKLIFRNILTYS